MNAIRITEYPFYSALHDEQMVRVSSYDRQGCEFWMAIPEHVPGQPYRARRQEAAETIDQAIRMGLQPGEVRVLQ